MIQLREARFSNFRGLRDVHLDFAASGEPALTVIRAENATGKTSMLYGLTWCLFGEAGLPVSPRRRDTYRISPVDWDEVADGPEVTVEVLVKVTVGDDEHEEDYEIVRRATETVRDDGFEWTQSTVEIFKETDKGTVPVQAPETFLELELIPPALKDIFFLDGDEALKDYVESARDDTRRNVRDAVRSLLGLEILEAARTHLDEVRRTITVSVKSESTGELVEISERIVTADNTINELTEAIAELEEDLKSVQIRFDDADRLRSDILANGGRESKDLEKQERGVKQLVTETTRDMDLRIKQQRSLLSSPDLVQAIARETIGSASERYESLRRDHKIPNTLPDLVRERLQQGRCICGASLKPGTEGHDHLTEELDASQRFDDAHQMLTELAGLAVSAQAGSAAGPRSWFVQSKDNIAAWLGDKRTVDSTNVDLRELETRIRNATQSGDFDVADSRRTLELQHLTEKRSALGSKQQALTTHRASRETLRKQSEGLQRKETRFRKRLAEQQAVKDMLDVINGTIAVLQDETMSEVSNEMNRIFQDLLAAAPAEIQETPDTVVKEVILTKECDIVVRGPLGREINPSNGLSGAQRRALTIAFILALTKVSGVMAPLVIDTPLGMTSSTIRRALLENTLKNSRQIVMFLTRDEIKGVEDILDTYSGVHYTMTNTQHAIHAVDPSFAKNRPAEVILCSCRHDDNCSICARKGD